MSPCYVFRYWHKWEWNIFQKCWWSSENDTKLSYYIFFFFFLFLLYLKIIVHSSTWQQLSQTRNFRVNKFLPIDICDKKSYKIFIIRTMVHFLKHVRTPSGHTILNMQRLPFLSHSIPSSQASDNPPRLSNQ